MSSLKKYIEERKYNKVSTTFLIDAIITGIEKNAIKCIKYIADQNNNLFCIQLIENAIIKISEIPARSLQAQAGYQAPERRTDAIQSGRRV